MRIETLTFIVLAAAISVFQAGVAQKPKAIGSIYNMLDRISWLIGGFLTTATGLWKPWFTNTWWKAVLLAPVLVTAYSALFLSMMGTSLANMQANKTSRLITGLFLRIIVLLLIFYILKSVVPD